jgi:MFS family permease
LDEWGWRAAFLIGAAIVPLAIFLRNDLSEPTETRAGVLPAEAGSPRLPLTVLLGLMLFSGGIVVSNTLNYLTTYTTFVPLR